MALSSGHFSRAMALIDAGADFDPLAPYIPQYVLNAAGSGDVGMLRLLISNKASIDVVDASGRNPLQIAQKRKRYAAV